jgi:hypothetical protein
LLSVAASFSVISGLAPGFYRPDYDIGRARGHYG